MASQNVSIEKSVFDRLISYKESKSLESSTKAIDNLLKEVNY